MEKEITFDFSQEGDGYSIVMQGEVGGENVITISTNNWKNRVFIDATDNDTSFKDYFNLLSYYAFQTREELDAFIETLPKEVRDEIREALNQEAS